MMRKLTEQQQQQFIAFVVNFLSMMHEKTNVTYEQAETMLHLAVSVLLGAVFHVSPPDDDDTDIDPFIPRIIELALKREFSKKTEVKVVD